MAKQVRLLVTLLFCGLLSTPTSAFAVASQGPKDLDSPFVGAVHIDPKEGPGGLRRTISSVERQVIAAIGAVDDIERRSKLEAVWETLIRISEYWAYIDQISKGVEKHLSYAHQTDSISQEELRTRRTSFRPNAQVYRGLLVEVLDFALSSTRKVAGCIPGVVCYGSGLVENQSNRLKRQVRRLGYLIDFGLGPER